MDGLERIMAELAVQRWVNALFLAIAAADTQPHQPAKATVAASSAWCYSISFLRIPESALLAGSG